MSLNYFEFATTSKSLHFSKFSDEIDEEGVTPVEVIKPGKGKEENEAKLN